MTNHHPQTWIFGDDSKVVDSQCGAVVMQWRGVVIGILPNSHVCLLQRLQGPVLCVQPNCRRFGIASITQVQTANWFVLLAGVKPRSISSSPVKSSRRLLFMNQALFSALWKVRSSQPPTLPNGSKQQLPNVLMKLIGA